jgi:hypothetical protein
MVARGTDPRSGKPVTMNVMDVCRFEDGKMVEHWGIPDRFAYLHQLGLPARAADLIPVWPAHPSVIRSRLTIPCMIRVSAVERSYSG